MPPPPKHDQPRRQIVCAACRAGMIHKTVVLHAGVDTLITCLGAWDALPSWLRESFGQVKKGQPIEERREVAREILDELESQSRAEAQTTNT